MSEKITRYMEKDKKKRTLGLCVLTVLLLIAVLCFVYGNHQLNADPGVLEYQGSITLYRNYEQEDYDEDSTYCDVVYEDGERKLIVAYPYEEYVKLQQDQIEAYEYSCEDGTKLYFDHRDPDISQVRAAYQESQAELLMPVYNLGNSLLILSLSVLIMILFAEFFSLYEKCWFLSIMVLATIFAVIFPEESANGVSGIAIMLLYLLDTFLNILCELLISKQSRYNFLVSVAVEITEIVICLVLRYRFATMAVTLFFWLPIDIVSFINWSRHLDDKEDELTRVRQLKGYQEVLVILAIALWTIGVGYFLSGLHITTDFLDPDLEVWINYLDACASAVGIANGLFIFFRLREQWLAWYICAFLEALINILTGQYVLLILKLGYFTNTTYGYIRWSRYIREHREDDDGLF